MTDTFRQSRPACVKLLPQAMPIIHEALKYDWRSIIDFGCGYGLHVAEFAKAGREATGIDLGLSVEAELEAEGKDYVLIEGKWEDLADESYDAGYSHHCLEHLRDPIGGLHEWGRIIRAGGYLFVSVPAYTPTVLAGHISNGWNIGQLAYNLAVAGFDCKQGRFCIHGGSVWAVAPRPSAFSLAETVVNGWGEALARMPAQMNIEGNVATANPLDRLNW